MNEQEYPDQALPNDRPSKEQPTEAILPTGEQPLILYDIAAMIGAIYHQPLTVTRQKRLTNRFVKLLHPHLHISPRYDEQGKNGSADMLLETAEQLGLITLAFSQHEDDRARVYRLRYHGEMNLRKWSQSNRWEQARTFLAHWRRSKVWRDIWNADMHQWDASDWNPLAARGLLLDLLGTGLYKPEKWYLLSPLYDTIWSRGPYALRPRRQKASTRTHEPPYSMRHSWDRCDRLVYLGILSSTLSELGMVSLSSSPAASSTGEPTRLKLTEFGAQVLSKQQPVLSTKGAQQLLVVQPSYEVILLQFDPPTLYRLLPFAEIEHIDLASHLRLTRDTVWQGISSGLSVEQMLATLNASDQKPVPQNVSYTMRDWARTYRGATIEEVLLIEVSNETLVKELCSSPQWRPYGLEKIASRRLLAHEVYDQSTFRQQLTEAGIALRE